MHFPSSSDQLPEVTHISPHQSTISEVHEDLSIVPILSTFPVFSPYDHFPALTHQTLCLQIGAGESESYPWPIDQSDLGSDYNSVYCSPHPLPHAKPVFTPALGFAPAERTHTNSDRRRAQNRAAQRAFHQRKEMHTRNLEAQVATLSENYAKLVISHSKLTTAYKDLWKTMKMLTQDNDAEDEDEGEEGKESKTIARRIINSDTLRNLLEKLLSEFNGARTAKTEI
ncbi:uncharacterized protein ALTATR162_LOCUS33 [Alternaria atra]|uniref:BZIP domain-containing protein n=1 Tax=Alternaria atra TaxID=119953 RepID=A0A8J2HUS9_9PLEO|nr:uncharacterized protein ALTATR162_LOCUS33 [Alternaria atra]CAG5137048.1 unnamed protein product [Alternaria atra]